MGLVPCTSRRPAQGALLCGFVVTRRPSRRAATWPSTSVRDGRGRVVQTGSGMPQVDVDDGWSALGEFVALHGAHDPVELHRRLLCFGAGGGNKADAFEPWCLFHGVHADQPDGAAVTALLLLTDRRWRNATSRLVRRIDESGLVPDDQLDLLAHTFLAAGPQVYWEAPGDWFAGPAIVLDPDGDDVVDAADIEDQEEEPDDGPVVFAREIRPPLRRWATARIVRSDPGGWAPLVKRAREVDPRDGAAIMFGLLDGIDAVAPAAAGFIIGIAERWPHRKLREAAMAFRHSPEAASASVRGEGRRRTAASRAAQTSLF